MFSTLIEMLLNIPGVSENMIIQPAHDFNNTLNKCYGVSATIKPFKCQCEVYPTPHDTVVHLILVCLDFGHIKNKWAFKIIMKVLKWWKSWVELINARSSKEIVVASFSYYIFYICLFFVFRSIILKGFLHILKFLGVI